MNGWSSTRWTQEKQEQVLAQSRSNPMVQSEYTCDQAFHLVLALDVDLEGLPESVIVQMCSSSCCFNNKLLPRPVGSWFLQQPADEGNAVVDLFRFELAKVQPTALGTGFTRKVDDFSKRSADLEKKAILSDNSIGLALRQPAHRPSTNKQFFRKKKKKFRLE
jgi:hypothetical protein